MLALDRDGVGIGVGVRSDGASGRDGIAGNVGNDVRAGETVPPSPEIRARDGITLEVALRAARSRRHEALDLRESGLGGLATYI